MNICKKTAYGSIHTYRNTLDATIFFMALKSYYLEYQSFIKVLIDWNISRFNSLIDWPYFTTNVLSRLSGGRGGGKGDKDMFWRQCSSFSVQSAHQQWTGKAPPGDLTVYKSSSISRWLSQIRNMEGPGWGKFAIRSSNQCSNLLYLVLTSKLTDGNESEFLCYP